ncbi:MAG: restriction endonuclease subunit S, partial [Fervidicoccaceae archaeon]
ADNLVFYKETEFKDTEIGRIPKEWEVVRLSDVCTKITDRDHRTPAYVANGYPLIAPENFIGISDLDFINCRKISKDELERDRKRCDPIKGDLLLSRIGTIGLVRMVKTDQAFSILHSIALLRPNSLMIDGGFLLFWLQGPTIQLRLKLAVQSISTPDIGIDKIRTLPTVVPPLPEQQQIASILSTIDEAIQKTDELIAKTERLKKGMMQELLTKGIGHKEFKDTEIGRIP